MPSPYAEAEEVLATYDRPNGDKVRGMWSTYKGREYFSIRSWWQDINKGGEFRPGRNGINLPADELDAFLQLIAKMFPERVTLKEEEE